MYLEDWETEGTTRDTDDVVVDCGDDELIRLDEVGTTACSAKALSGGYSGCGGLWDDRNVGELTVVSRAHGVKADEVEGVRVRVVARLGWDNWSMEVGVDEGEVVRAHLRQTVGVLID